MRTSPFGVREAHVSLIRPFSSNAEPSRDGISPKPSPYFRLHNSGKAFSDRLSFKTTTLHPYESGQWYEDHAILVRDLMNARQQSKKRKHFRNIPSYWNIRKIYRILTLNRYVAIQWKN